MCFYIIKQGLNEPPGWPRILLNIGEGGNKRNHDYGNLFVLCSKIKPPRNLEIEHVSPIVAFVYNHMLLMALA